MPMLLGESPIQTSGANSRIAALQARKRPTIDVNDYGIAVESGGDLGSPLLTNRVDALSDRGLAGVQQRGFGSGREAISAAMDAAGRTYRTGRINDELEMAREELQGRSALTRDTNLAAQDITNDVGLVQQRGANAIDALKQRRELERQHAGVSHGAADYFNGMAQLQRQDQSAAASQTAYEKFIRDYQTKQMQEQLKAEGEAIKAEIAAGGQVDAARLQAYARAIEAFSNEGLDPAAPDTPGGMFSGPTPGAPNDQAQIDANNKQTKMIMDLLTGTPEGPTTPNAAGQVQASGTVNTNTGATTQAAPQQAADPQSRVVQAFANQFNLPVQQAEAILRRRGLLQ